MKKIIIFSTILFYFIPLKAQNKKEQIQILNNTLDSLMNVITQERTANNKESRMKDIQILSLQVQLDKIKQGKDSLLFELNKTQEEKHQLIQEVAKLSRHADSLKKHALITKNKSAIPQGAIKGDFNGDGIFEYMWLQAPKTNDMECVGECNCIIMFSNPTINSIEVQNCIGGFPTNVGDLNNNGTDEIGFTPAWFTSCWSSYYVWTFKNEDWSNAVDPFLTHCNQWDEGVQPIEKDISKEGNVIVRYSEQNEGGDILTKIKSIKIVK